MARGINKAPLLRWATKEDECLILLDVDRADLENVPCISGILRDAQVMDNLWDYLDASERQEARKLLKLRKTLPPGIMAECPVEALCLAAGLETRKVLEMIMGEVFMQEHQASQLLAAAKHREVVAATVKKALGTQGTAERKLLLQASGFAPVPKTYVTNIHGSGQVQIGGKSQTVMTLPPTESMVKKLSDRFGEIQVAVPMLPEPSNLDDESEEEEEE